MMKQHQVLRKVVACFQKVYAIMMMVLLANVYWAKPLKRVPNGSIVFFPYQPNLLSCGLAGIVAFKRERKPSDPIPIEALDRKIDKIQSMGFAQVENNPDGLEKAYLGGQKYVEELNEGIRSLKQDNAFVVIYQTPGLKLRLKEMADRLTQLIDVEQKLFNKNMGHLTTSDVGIMSSRIESLKDTAWCLNVELIDNVDKIKALLNQESDPDVDSILLYKQINAVLNSIDRLEVRGRDSAGISLVFVLDQPQFNAFEAALQTAGMSDEFQSRTKMEVLINKGIAFTPFTDAGTACVSIAMTFKVAAEIGSLGDNIRFLRSQIQTDSVLKTLKDFKVRNHSILAHTRWASVGAITEPNCHPVDNRTLSSGAQTQGIIHVCLNGDIDNYLDLKAAYEKEGVEFQKDVTTDTKIIPVTIEHFLGQGKDIVEAFRLAVNCFEGSHAICMHTNLAPGKLFLAQRGSGQAIFVGISDDHLMPTSEVYGFVEETSRYIKLDGEKIIETEHGTTQGQIVILSQDIAAANDKELDGLTGMYYDRTPLILDQNLLKCTEITSRDIDRQGFPHYYIKEISEAPVSVERTLQNRWKVKEGSQDQYEIVLDQSVVPQKIKSALEKGTIRRIYFVGQGTAGIAAKACQNILDYYLADPMVQVSALKASELSGFKLLEHDDKLSMNDALVVAITQSGTTTDTNRTVDMVKERGALTMAIVNRRDSDITFKVDGVLYTSSGRDLEMSVASTKAFYSQIVAGAILNLYIARIKKRRNDEFVTQEIKRLLDIPDHMRTVLKLRPDIERSAKRLAVKKIYWAAVGSGPNKASADEIRIKLSELCYKTISSDYIEDKKHIDLSSEPLIIVCAAGTRRNVIGDIIKDTAIFKAHKASPVVIVDEGETRFSPYAEDVFAVPVIGEHLAPILNTLVGHLWGYYAALAINDGSRFLYDFRKSIQTSIDDFSNQGLDVYELVLEKTFREKIARFYSEFRKVKSEGRFPITMGHEAASDLTLLLKYLSGSTLPVSDFELDFGIKGTAINMINQLFECVGKSINTLARPVDAIKHQAKTVTVGTSRISEKVEGILFEALEQCGFKVSQLTTSNVLVLKNLQRILEKVTGTILYEIGQLNLLGEPTDDSTIRILKKEGILKGLTSRVETDNRLQGTKKIIVRQGNVYIGIGRKDKRSILVIPIISGSSITPNAIGHLMLLNYTFKQNVTLQDKIKALGGKYENIKSFTQETSGTWKPEYIELVEMRELFGMSAEKVSESIAGKL